MAISGATVIIEPHFLVREALDSLIRNHPYRVVCSVGSAADIGSASMVGDGPKLVILGPQSADNAAIEAVSIRKMWSDSKIVLLFENASVADFQKLLTSEIDGCVPLFVSPETLFRALELVMLEDARFMVSAGTKRPAIQMDGSTEHKATPITHNGNTQRVATLGNRPRLSEREAQILDGLVKGYANKMIARSCDITEAMVKVHMKSILRKIQVANRTQAAVWALEHGHSVDETTESKTAY
jgi:two-component system, NarL family, nitrate/nitrite response regulator NarL